MKLSIVTVALNSADHIASAIESVIAQDVPVAEYIVIDGQSADETVAIVESYRPALGDRLVVVSEKDGGLYDAMNKGIARATGDVIGILNSDDRCLPGAFAAVEEAFRSQEADIYYGEVVVAESYGRRIMKGSTAAIRSRMSIGHPACFVRKNAYARWGTFDTRYALAADYDFLLRCYLGGARFLHVDHLLAEYNPGGASSQTFRIAREIYAIHRRHLGTSHAARWYLHRTAGALLLHARRGLGTALLGTKRYERLRDRWRRRSLPPGAA